MDFTSGSYRAFELFDKDWALVTAGTPDDFNTMTVSWGELGSIWDHRPVVTAFVHPSRHTSEFVKRHDEFTVSFYDKQYRKALAYLGSHSGRDGDKVATAGLTPTGLGGGVTFEEARLTFLCRKIYLHQMSKDGLAPQIRDLYASRPTVYPNVTPDGTGDSWEPHYALIGEIVDAEGEIPA